MAENKKIPIEITYDCVNWEDDVTPLDAEHLNIMDAGIKGVTNAYNALPSWTKSELKPTYTSNEVGADPAGTAENKLDAHNTSANAHAGFLAAKYHNHNIKNLEGYDKLKSKDTELFNNKEPEYYLDYTHFINTPVEKTKVSEFENDVGYLTAENIRLQLKGTYAYGFVTDRKVFSTPFAPVELVIYEKEAYNSDITSQIILDSDYIDDVNQCYVLFEEDGFVIQCAPGGPLNKEGHIYLWYALSVTIHGSNVGPTGPAGIMGPRGETGDVGPTGSKGSTGDRGAMGPTGMPGRDGIAGPIGPTGPQGTRGFDGERGATGPQGERGLVGPTGPRGAGSAGPTGAMGMEGPIGPTGSQGRAGAVGPTGAQGIQGPTGASAVLPSNLEYTTNKTLTISANSTDTEYPSAKAVYDYIQNTIYSILNTPT